MHLNNFPIIIKPDLNIYSGMFKMGVKYCLIPGNWARSLDAHNFAEVVHQNTVEFSPTSWGLLLQGFLIKNNLHV